MHIGTIDYPGAGPKRFQVFSAARQQLLTTLHAWLRTSPETQTVEAEMAATLSAIRQVATLQGVAP